MQPWIEQCERWLAHEYQDVLGLAIPGGPVQLRWLPADSLTSETTKADAHGLAIEDADIGWLLYLLPYKSDRLESQVNQALGLRSRLLRESNYTGSVSAGEREDQSSTWRVGLIWLVQEDNWADWQRHIMKLRRESGAAEEISVDAIKVSRDEIQAALDAHGLPRLLLHTRALLSQSATEAEKWLSADIQVAAELENFSQQFDNSRTRAFARQLEEKAKSIQPKESPQVSSDVRDFVGFRVRHFRNLDSLEIVADQSEDAKAQAIVLFGPNGTGKSSFAEALSLAAFGTSPRLEKFLADRDVTRATAQTYFNEYLTPVGKLSSLVETPCFTWGKSAESPFVLNSDEKGKRLCDGVVLNQEDSIKFSELPSEELAAQVLKGYSDLADELSAWLAQEEKRANDVKLSFTRKHGLSGAIKRSATAYDRLAQSLMAEQLQRPSPEFLDWLRFIGRTSDEDGRFASKLASAWTSQQVNVVDRLADTVAKLQQLGATHADTTKAIREKLDEFGDLAAQSDDFRKRLEGRIVTLREQLEIALVQLESWGLWLASQSISPAAPESDNGQLKMEIDKLAKERAELETNGKALRGRLELLDQAKQFIASGWHARDPDTCPVCDSDVAERKGIAAVVATLQAETNATIQSLRDRHVVIQNQQRELDAKLKAYGLATCPLGAEDQSRLRDWLHPFLPENVTLEGFIVNPQHRELLKGDLSRLRILPEAPKPYADTTLEAERLTSEFIAMAHEADKALEDPQSIGEVRKAFEQRLENVLKDHLPSKLGKVWQEIAMSMTTATWLLPANPALKIERRGKSVSVQASNSGRYLRYLYNAAERHVLGLAWFFTYYIAKRRFQVAWMLLDDPAQEMDQPSFRELVHFWETLLRIHQRQKRPFTMIVALHQEERALDATRATNGQLYMLGWQKEQQETNTQSSVKKVVLLAPGYHPLKPEEMFSA